MLFRRDPAITEAAEGPVKATALIDCRLCPRSRSSRRASEQQRTQISRAAYASARWRNEKAMSAECSPRRQRERRRRRSWRPHHERDIERAEREAKRTKDKPDESERKEEEGDERAGEARGVMNARRRGRRGQRGGVCVLQWCLQSERHRAAPGRSRSGSQP